MKQLLSGFLALALTLIFGLNSADAQIKVQWFGQSCFLITSPKGVKILIDPFNPELGYPMPKVKPDLVLISHEHFDHNYYQMASGSPKIIHGLNPKTLDWEKIDETLKDVRVYSVRSYHDEAQGARRGKNTIFVIELPGARMAFLGDLGCPLSKEQIEKLGKIEVLMVPVGGVYTIDAEGANQVIAQLNPKLIFPMHYKTPAVKLPIEPVDKFLADKKDVQKISGNEYVINQLPAKPQIIVLDWK